MIITESYLKMIINFGILINSMIVCLCQAVTEKKVRAAIDSGASTRREVTRACRAGAGCGGCHSTIRDLIRDQQMQSACDSCVQGPAAEDFLGVAAC